MRKNVSIVIPTKNGGRLFHEVLKGLLAQDFAGSVEILVIDSGSNDDTVAFAKEQGVDVVSIPPETFSHGGTRNQAIGICSGEIIILTTQDAVPGDRFLIHNLVSAFEDQYVAGAYARQLPQDDADIFTKRNLNNWMTGRTESEVRQLTDLVAYNNMNPIDRYMICNFDNVCSAVRRSIWEKIPLATSDFGEDIDWSKRVLEAGWKIAYQAKAFVIHSHDRPILYEYKRTYMCHRKLYELFKVNTIPSKMHIFLSVYNSIKNDTSYAIKHEKNVFKLLSLLSKVVPLAIASVFGQYCGARDEKLSIGKKHSGV